MSEVAPGSADPGFFADLRSSLRVIRDRPLLPILSLLLWTVPVLIPAALFILGLPIAVFRIGFPGTERLWILRGLREEDFSGSDAWHRTWNYVPRYWVLGLAMWPVLILFGAVGFAITRSFVGLYVGVTLATLLLDFALTFVTPALTFVTTRVREALSIGLRMIRTEWPKNAAYVLFPPLALILLSFLIPNIAAARHFDDQFREALKGHRPEPISQSYRLIYAGLAAVGALAGLCFKGATAAFFARRFPVPPWGSANPEKQPTLPPPPSLPPPPPRPDDRPGEPA